MKKSLKYSGAIVAALLAVAPVVVNNSAVVNADSTTQVAKNGQPGDSKDNPIVITYTIGYPKSALEKEKDHNKNHPYDYLDKGATLYTLMNYKDGGYLIVPYYIYENGKLIRNIETRYKVDGKTGAFIDKDGNPIKNKYGTILKRGQNINDTTPGHEDADEDAEKVLKEKGVLLKVPVATKPAATGSQGGYEHGDLIPGKLASAPTISLQAMFSPFKTSLFFKPNTWYKFDDNGEYSGFPLVLKTNSNGIFDKDRYLMPGFIFRVPEKTGLRTSLPAENEVITSESKGHIDDDFSKSDNINHKDNDAKKDSNTTPSTSKDDHKSDSTTKTSPSTPATDASSSSKSDSSKDTSSTSTSTTTPSTSHSTVDSNSEISSSTPISNPSIDKKNEVTSSKSDNEPAAEVSNSKTKTTVKTSSTKRVLAHNAYVYTNKGKLAKKSKKHILLKKGATVDTFGKQVTIKGKKFYKIAKNQYVKVANFVTGSKAIKVKVTATVKGKKNAKVSTYTSTGKLTKMHVYGKKTYKFNQKKTIKGKTYYKLTAKNQWVLANKLALKK